MKNMEEIKKEIKNLITEKGIIVEHSTKGKYTTYEIDKLDCIGQWDLDTNILTIKRKDTK